MTIFGSLLTFFLNSSDDAMGCDREICDVMCDLGHTA